MSSVKRSIGDIGEDYIEQLCQLPIGRDFLFRGPRYMTDKGEVELCDLLILLGDTAILIEIKTADREKRPDRTEDDWANFANRRYDQTVQQLTRGVEAIKSGDIKSVTNDRQGEVTIDHGAIQNLYAISVVDHPTLDIWGKSPSLDIKDEHIVVLCTTHTDLADLFTELSTPTDLIEYMEARKLFFQKHSLMGICELDLLAYYKSDPDQFHDQVESADMFMLADDLWEGYSQTEQRQNRALLDTPSFIIDDMINNLHRYAEEDLDHVSELNERLGGKQPDKEGYVRVATELAKIRRIDRRLLGMKILEKSELCLEQNRDRYFASYSSSRDGPLLVFLISQYERKRRCEWLLPTVLGAIYHYDQSEAVGFVLPPIDPANGFVMDTVWISRTKAQVVEMFSPQDLKNLPQFSVPKHSQMTEFELEPEKES